MVPPTDSDAVPGILTPDASIAANQSDASATTLAEANGRQSAKEAQTQPGGGFTSLDTSSDAKNGWTSRETSPIRARTKSTPSSASQDGRSRKSSQELSPTRASALSGSFASVPSAAAIQRALSAQKPQLQPSSVDGVLEGSRGDKVSRSGDNSPHWPISPRLRSPPPSSTASRSSIPTLRKSDSDATPSNTSLKRLTAASTPSLPTSTDKVDLEKDDGSPLSGFRTPARGVSSTSPALETVVESSLPTTPSIGPLLNSFTDKKFDLDHIDGKESKDTDQNHNAASKAGTGSGNENGAEKNNSDKVDPNKSNSTPAARPAASLAKRSLTNLAPTKGKPPVEPLRSMTVETETVSSVPQVALGVGERGASGRMNSNGSVRQKPSSETIKPKKEKKKMIKKPTSLHTGTVSSKADIFEAKVASAVDEANSSDSDETFVYESNPPESRNPRHANHHSRTPSATSLASQLDQYGNRSRQGTKDGSHSVAGKRSMKFTNSAYNNGHVDGEISNYGSTRGSAGSAKNSSSTPRHHHIGRYGRGGHTSIFDTDSPFTQANKPSSPRTALRPGSPRVAGGKVPSSPKKADMYSYDLDEDGADDERAPLVGSVRINRNRHSRRPNSGNYRHVEYIEQQHQSYCSRYGACIIVTLLLLVLCAGAGTFVTALNQPLMNVSIKHIQNVLASEQEIMLDLDVQATNPNLFAITVTDLDINVFAKSGYVGTGPLWREQQGNKSSPWMTRRRKHLASKVATGATITWPHLPDGVDEGTDPIDDPEGDPQTMLLGRIFEFDSPLVFEPAPLRRTPASSVGEIRLAKPGNKTEEGGSARWERVLQHPFDLIVRGVIRYQLPISSRTRSASLGSRIKVFPKDDADDKEPV